MGDLRRGDASRGQLLIITALTLAVLLSVLTLTLNTAVFGGAYVAQTDEGVRAERGAAGFQAAVERGVAGLIPRVNDRNDDYDTLEADLVNSTAAWTGLADGEYARESVATNASVQNVTYETRVFQNSTQDFTDNASSANWTVASDVSNVSGYDMNIQEDQLIMTDNCSGSCFSLELSETNGSDTWRMTAYRNGSQGVNVTIQTTNSTYSCGTNEPSARINVTSGTFDDGLSTCTFPGATEDPGLDPPYTLTYANANKVEGTYNLTVTGRVTPGPIDGNDSYVLVGESGSPFADPRVTAANVSVRYESSTLRYNSTVRVTPGDGDD